MKKVKILINILIFSILFLIIPNKITADDNILSYELSCPEGYCITKYSVNMIVNEDNSFDITEDIDVIFTEHKHGIFRKLPLRNKVVRNDGSTSSNRAKITNISSSDNSSIYNESGYKVIKIGDPDKTLIGEKSYKISYKYDIGKDKAKNFDELYFNIIGTEWDTYIDNVSFNIVMPKEFDSSKIGFSAGSKGTIGTNKVNYTVDGNVITGTYEDKLSPYEGITIRLELPEGYFAYEYKPNYAGILSIVLPIIFAIIAYSIYKNKGVDDVIVETVEFYPPYNFNSLDMGYYYNGKASPKDVTSLLIYLANKGYIKITDRDEEGNLLKHNNFYITKLKDYDGNDSREEKFLKGLFKKTKNYTFWGKEIEENNDNSQVEKKDLTNRFYTTISSILSSTNTKGNKQKVFEKRDKKSSLIIWILVIISFGLMIYSLYANDVDLELLMAMVMFVIVGILALIGGISQLFLKFYDEVQYKYESSYSLGGAILSIIVGVIFLGIITAIMYYNGMYLDIISIIGLFITMLSVSSMVACYNGLQKRTEFGKDIIGKIYGFKNFLETAEKEKLETLVSENPTYFYDILPYTYVLGVSKKWISKFESISIEPPSWYDYGHAAYNVSMMDTFMNKTFVSAASTLNSSPSSSGGSGGGGFSGGGSGGGGGGSW